MRAILSIRVILAILYSTGKSPAAIRPGKIFTVLGAKQQSSYSKIKEK